MEKCFQNNSNPDSFAQCMLTRNDKIDKELLKLNWRMVFAEKAAEKCLKAGNTKDHCLEEAKKSMMRTTDDYFAEVRRLT